MALTTQRAVFLVQCQLQTSYNPAFIEHFVIKIPTVDLIKYDTIDFHSEVKKVLPGYMEISCRKIEVKQVQYLYIV